MSDCMFREVLLLASGYLRNVDCRSRYIGDDVVLLCSKFYQRMPLFTCLLPRESCLVQFDIVRKRVRKLHHRTLGWIVGRPCCLIPRVQDSIKCDVMLDCMSHEIGACQLDGLYAEVSSPLRYSFNPPYDVSLLVIWNSKWCTSENTSCRWDCVPENRSHVEDEFLYYDEMRIKNASQQGSYPWHFMKIDMGPKRKICCGSVRFTADKVYRNELLAMFGRNNGRMSLQGVKISLLHFS